jgi:hypothetical protein
VYQRQYLARGRAAAAETAAALAATRAAAAAAAAERAALLERNEALSSVVGYMDGVVDAFSALCSTPPAARLGASPAPGAAAGAPPAPGEAPAEAPAEASPMLRSEGWAANVEAAFRRLLLPSNAVMRAGARLAPTGRIAEVVRFTAHRTGAALAAW